MMEEKPILKLRRYEENTRVNDLGIAICHSHSEFMSAACTKLWYYKYYKCYSDSGFKSSLVYGVLFHLVIEEVINNISKIDSKPSRCSFFLDLLKDASNKVYDEMSDNCEGNQLLELEEELDSCRDRIVNIIDGWIPFWMDIIKDYDVIATEKVLIKPIMDLEGNQLTANVVVDAFYDGDNNDIVMIQRDGVNNGSGTAMMEVPVYKIGTVDVILQNKTTKGLYILDHKTSGSPSSYSNRLKFDLQLQSYAALLRYEITHGSMQEYKDCKINGVWWDISHSNTPSIPKRLASGKLSTAKKAAPYWQYLDAIKEYDLDIADYKDHIQYLEDLRFKYINLVTDIVTKDQMDIIDKEDFVQAARINKIRSELQSLDDEADADGIVYRWPQCQMYNSCSFSSPCLANTPYNIILNRQVPQFSWLVNKQ